MAKEGPDWDGLLKWSIAHSDGTRPTRNLSEEDRRWFMEAMQAQSVDVIRRMKEITLVMQTPEEVLEAQGVTAADIEDMLDELQEHVESIDMANDLHSIGGLAPLLGYLRNSHPGIRAKSAEVVTTIVQNNPKSQQLVMEANGLEPLLSNFSFDPDVTVRTKALGAISSLIRFNKPGIAAFRLANGYAALRDALGSENVRFQRRVLASSSKEESTPTTGVQLRVERHEAGGSSGIVFAWDIRWGQQPIILSGSGVGDAAIQSPCESEVWEVQYDPYQSSNMGKFSTSQILPIMSCSEDGILATVEQGEESVELLAEPCAINSFDIDKQNPSDVIFSLEWESLAILTRP